MPARLAARSSNCGTRQETSLAVRDDALRRAAEEIRAGEILALKGVGGFQLLADARNESAVKRLRERKRREEKPFALMYPSLESDSRGLPRFGAGGAPAAFAGSAHCAAPAPVVAGFAPSLAPGNPNLGVMLPSSPLHHLLLRELGFPVVATSGNLSDEPICIDEHEALRRLAGIADFFLVHNRPIVRHVDDSVVRVVRGREMVLRRARGLCAAAGSSEGTGCPACWPWARI